MDFLTFLERRRAELDGHTSRHQFSQEEAQRGREEYARRARERTRSWMHRVLRVVREDPGLSVSGVAEELDCSLGWASELVGQMREEGLVRAERDRGDSGQGQRLCLFIGKEAER